MPAGEPPQYTAWLVGGIVNHETGAIWYPPYNRQSYNLAEGAGRINERMASLLSHLESETTLRGDEKIEAMARRIAASLPEKENVNINEWARRLAKDLADSMRVFARILAVLTAAATVIGLMAVYLHCVELKASYRKYKKWELEERNSYE